MSSILLIDLPFSLFRCYLYFTHDRFYVFFEIILRFIAMPSAHLIYFIQLLIAIMIDQKVSCVSF